MPQRKPPASTPFAPRDYGAALRPWLLGGVAALWVARSLVPSEGVADKGGGAPFVMLWIGLALAWAAAGVASGKLTVRFGWIDAAAIVLAAWHAVSGLWAVQRAAPRPALNALWEWAGMVLAYLLARQLVRTPREARAWAAVMVGLAVGFVAYSVYDREVIQPATRAVYYADPAAGLREANVAPENRKQFEDRLNDRAPLATFTLTNSLAGFLAPWSIVALGVALAEGQRSRRRTALAAAACCAAIGACIYWTESRTAYLAVAVGVVALLAVALRPWRRLRSWRGWIAAVVLTAVLAAVVSYAFAFEILDHDLFFGAWRSLEVRLDYWRATAAMVADHPLLGVGPGNFQVRYVQYKLPLAEEEIADPHSFVFEVAATAGLPALAALLAVLGGFFRGTWRTRREVGEPLVPTSGKTATAQPADAMPHILVGIVVGPLLAMPLALVSGAPPNLYGMLLLVAAGIPAVVALAGWVRQGRLAAGLLAWAAVVMLVNLLAAGGIGFPGVALSLWLLLALELTVAAGFSPPTVARGGSASGLALAGILCVLGGACYFTAYRPTLTARGLMERAADDPRHAREILADAARADPWGGEARLQLAGVELEYWKHDARHGLEDFTAAADEALALQPYSSTYWFEVGNLYATANKLRPNPAVARGAADRYRRAAELYPSHPQRHARLAQAFWAAGDEAGAAEAAAEARRLSDRLPSRSEKKLPPELLQELGRRP